jgi:Phytanoyl-CoA dioxygenase (PhyH)
VTVTPVSVGLPHAGPAGDAGVPLLDSAQVALFVARGFLRLDEVVPAEVNETCLQEILADEAAGTTGAPSALKAGNSVGLPLSRCFPEAPGIRLMLQLPVVHGVIQSLVGPEPKYDHHAVHVRRPGEPAQQLHADAIIDTRLRFDIQLMYFPHDVPEDMGGTLLVPGSHLRRVNEHDISRYQNLAGQLTYFGPAGSILVLHHGIWHCGRRNERDVRRYMFKLRLNPATEQVRCWDTRDLADEGVRRRVLDVLRAKEPWYEAATGRLEIVNRAVLWRYLSGQADFDIDHWLGRLENAAQPSLVEKLPGHDQASG